MPDKANNKDPNKLTRNVDGTAEKMITADDMKRYKNAMDNTKSYVSGDQEWSSSSHQFSKR